MQLRQAAQIQGDDRTEIAADRVKAADHTRSAAERDDRDAVLGAAPQDCGDLVLATRQEHRVGRVLDTGILAAQQVQRRLAAGAEQSALVVDTVVVGSDDLG